LFRGRLKSCQPLRHIRKPLEIEAWFQRTTNRKRPSNGHETDDVT